MMRTTIFLLIGSTLLCSLAAAAPAVHTAQGWQLQNQHLAVSLDERTGALSVLDRQSGARFVQPDSVRDKLQCPPGKEFVVLATPAPITLDGRLGDWTGTRMVALDPSLVTPEKPWQIDSERDLSAAVGFRWDSDNLYALYLVVDDSFVPGSRSQKQWWEADAVEWFVGWDQAGFMLDGKDPGGYLWGDWKDWAKASARQVRDFAAEPEALALAAAAGLQLAGKSGYLVETATRIGALITLQPVTAGRRFRLAVGVNDADEPGKRAGQEYYPAGVRLGSSATYAVGVLADAGGAMPEIGDSRPTACSEVAPVGEDGLTYLLAADLPEATVGHTRCTVRLPEGSRDLKFASAFADGWDFDLPLPRGFLPEADDAEYVLCEYGDGTLVPADAVPPPVSSLSVFSALDMPGFGIISSRGSALCLFEDYDYSGGQLSPCSFGGRQRLAAAFSGHRNKQQRLPEYRLTWHFDGASGAAGCAALARRMREFCAAQGWVKTLRDKRAANPNEDRLMGAPDVWGSNGLAFAREARAAGIDRLLVSGSYPGAQIRGITDLGYLCGPYDQYVDTDESTQSYDGRKPTDAYVRIQEDGKKAQGWVTLDGSHSWFSRCSETALAGAQHKLPGEQQTLPYNARFLDVHTAMGLVACYSPDHPCTLTEDRQNKTEMLQWIRDRKLVVGGEHGRAWSAGVLDYQEGMMSGNVFFSWPAGHLVKIEKPEQISDRYLEWGIGYQHRVPFFELAFHDCVVSTWYWGDSVDYHEQVRPDLTDRKVAYTALYGTIPLLWASNLGFSFSGEGKQRFLQAYRNCCKVHEAVGYEPMVSHEFLTADRSVQRTRFGGGTTVTVNFGPQPVKLQSAGKTWTVPTNGIVADGPALHQHLALVDGKAETAISRPGYRFLETPVVRAVGGLKAQGPLTAQRLGPGRIRVSLQPGTRYAALDPAVLDPAWKPAPARLIEVGLDLQPLRQVGLKREGRLVVLPAAGTWQTFELLYGQAATAADVAIVAVKPAAGAEVRQGASHQLTVTLRNYGGAEARVALTAYWDQPTASRRAGQETGTVPGNATRQFALKLDTRGVAGRTTLLLSAATAAAETIAADNRATLSLDVTPDLTRWPLRTPLSLDLGGLDRTDAVVQAPADLAALFGGKTLDPQTLRVALLDAAGQPRTLLPTQFDPQPGKALQGSLLFGLSGRVKADRPLRCLLLAAPPGAGLLPAAGSALDTTARLITRDSYTADASAGALRPVSFRAPNATLTPLLKQVIFSSSATGWSEPEGKVTEFAVLSDGPVCTRLRTVVELRGGNVVTRLYSFYPQYFTVEVTPRERQEGLFSRVWYETRGTYEDDAGRVRTVDGMGKDEGVTSGYPNPKWYCYRNEQAAHACIALTPMSGQSYWDEGSALGQLGFGCAAASGTYAHVITGPQPNAEFAKQWYESLTKPVQVLLQ